MIEVTLQGTQGKTIYLNPHQIEWIESNPDTTLVMLSGKKLVVAGSREELLKKIVDYRRLIGAFKNEE